MHPARWIAPLVLALLPGAAWAFDDEPIPLEQDARSAWTVLLYGAVDNDWERDFLRDVRDLRRGLAGASEVEVILLIDRSARYSRDADALGEDFADTRLYRLTGGAAERLDGAPELSGIGPDSSVELDTGDAATLRSFLRFGKRRFPARHYALFLVSHGEGMSFCPDEQAGDDQLFPAELTDVLEEQDSVDLLGFDACLMGGVENAYQWRRRPGQFGADYLVASAPVSSSWPYPDIFGRLRAGGDEVARPSLDPAALTAEGFAGLIVEELGHQIREGRSGDEGLERDLQAWASLDLSATEEAKRRLDALAVRLWEDGEKSDLLALRGAGLDAETFVYVWPERDAEVHMPHVDLLHLTERIAASPDFEQEAREFATLAARAADAVVVHSVGFDHYEGFVPGRHGLYVIFPDGDRRTEGGPSYWERIPWYSPLRIEGNGDAYGGYGWCADGSVPGNGKVETWFELMDAWFDDDVEGGVNGYRF